MIIINIIIKELDNLTSGEHYKPTQFSMRDCWEVLSLKMFTGPTNDTEWRRIPLSRFKKMFRAAIRYFHPDKSDDPMAPMATRLVLEAWKSVQAHLA